VLSAPPAFVLSQDQTLREELIAGKESPAIFFTLSLCSKSIPSNRDVTGSFVSSPAPKDR
jgi:hypothetical protein